MRKFVASLVALAALASAGVASAQDARLGDRQFIAAARCAGLAEAAGDGASFSDLLKAQRRGREASVRDEAGVAKNRAKSEWQRADADQRQALQQELADCNRFVG